MLDSVDTASYVFAHTCPSNREIPVRLSPFEAALRCHPLSEACPDLHPLPSGGRQTSPSPQPCLPEPLSSLFGTYHFLPWITAICVQGLSRCQTERLHGPVERAWTLEPHDQALNLALPLRAVGHQGTHTTFGSLSFLICKLRLAVPTFKVV